MNHSHTSMSKNAQFFSFMNETFELFENYVKMNQKIIARFQVLKEVGKSFEIDFMKNQNSFRDSHGLGDDFYEDNTYQKSNQYHDKKSANMSINNHNSNTEDNSHLEDNNHEGDYNNESDQINDGYYGEENHDGEENGFRNATKVVIIQ